MMDYDAFIGTVAKRTDLPWSQAESIARASLQVLGDRLSGGEADDLAAQLPEPLREPLRRARRKTAESFGRAEFVSRVAELSGVDGDRAPEAVRATFTMVRECATGDEFDDVMSQLPREYLPLFGTSEQRGGAGQ